MVVRFSESAFRMTQNEGLGQETRQGREMQFGIKLAALGLVRWR